MPRPLRFSAIPSVGLLALLMSVACSKSEGKNELPKDTALAQDLKEVVADTSAYVDAADVAMREVPDSELVVPKNRGPASRPATKPTMRVPSQTEPTARPEPTPSAPSRPTPMKPPPEANDVRPSIPLGEPTVSACDSPASADQRRCLMSFLARSDVGLDRTYQELIAELKRRDGAAGGDPASVQQLRVAQRAWLVYRDTECRRRNRGQEGPLWAPTRARCLAEFSADRERELRTQITGLQGR